MPRRSWLLWNVLLVGCWLVLSLQGAALPITSNTPPSGTAASRSATPSNTLLSSNSSLSRPANAFSASSSQSSTHRRFRREGEEDLGDLEGYFNTQAGTRAGLLEKPCLKLIFLLLPESAGSWYGPLGEVSKNDFGFSAALIGLNGIIFVVIAWWRHGQIRKGSPPKIIIAGIPWLGFNQPAGSSVARKRMPTLAQMHDMHQSVFQKYRNMPRRAGGGGSQQQQPSYSAEPLDRPPPAYTPRKQTPRGYASTPSVFSRSNSSASSSSVRPPPPAYSSLSRAGSNAPSGPSKAASLVSKVNKK